MASSAQARRCQGEVTSLAAARSHIALNRFQKAWAIRGSAGSDGCAPHRVTDLAAVAVSDAVRTHVRLVHDHLSFWKKMNTSQDQGSERPEQTSYG